MRFGSAILQENAQGIVPSGTTTPSCAPAGISTGNVSTITTTRPVTLGHAPFPQQSGTNSRLILGKFAKRTRPHIQPEYSGRDLTIPGQRKNYPAPSPLQQLHVVCQASPWNNLPMTLASPTMTTLSSAGATMEKSPCLLQIGSLPTTFAPRPPPLAQQKYQRGCNTPKKF